MSPVKVGSKIRARAVTGQRRPQGSAIEVVRNVTVEIEGEYKPALVAEWVTRAVYG